MGGRGECNDMKTVLITGASSGIGLAMAIYFYEHQWNVIATISGRHGRQSVIDRALAIAREVVFRTTGESDAGLGFQ
jgi:NAD(P)-dependent dehydrogenase (short-subunit alcohol dehydrogenase family)